LQVDAAADNLSTGGRRQATAHGGNDGACEKLIGTATKARGKLRPTKARANPFVVRSYFNLLVSICDNLYKGIPPVSNVFITFL
jgi:hypothetical protein